ncbi:MAG: tetratricopeptide repeat protein [Alphaproteobacteria bacterium]|nr:tetratricopeptide repeat protein [Alphaproteobacteria bacterium]
MIEHVSSLDEYPSAKLQFLFNHAQQILNDFQDDPEIVGPLAAAYDVMGDFHIKDRRFPEAIRCYSQSLKIDPSEQNKHHILQKVSPIVSDFFGKSSIEEICKTFYKTLNYTLYRDAPELAREVEREYINLRKGLSPTSPLVQLKQDAAILYQATANLTDDKWNSRSWSAFISTVHQIRAQISPDAALIYIGFYADCMGRNDPQQRHVEGLCAGQLDDTSITVENLDRYIHYSMMHKDLRTPVISQVHEVVSTLLQAAADVSEAEKQKVTEAIFAATLRAFRHIPYAKAGNQDLLAQTPVNVELVLDQRLFHSKPSPYSNISTVQMLFALNQFDNITSNPEYCSISHHHTLLKLFEAVISNHLYGDDVCTEKFFRVFKRLIQPDDLQQQINVLGALDSMFPTGATLHNIDLYNQCLSHALDVLPQFSGQHEKDVLSLYRRLAAFSIIPEITDRARALRNSLETKIDQRHKNNEAQGLCMQFSGRTAPSADGSDEDVTVEIYGPAVAIQRLRELSRR